MPSSLRPKFPTLICKFKKAIYDLKQAPRAWFHRFNSFLLPYGFPYISVDPSIYVACNGAHIVGLLLQVGDIILTGSTSTLLHSFIQLLSHHFAMKDLGDLHYFLGIQVVRSSSGLFLSQEKYVLDLLCKFQLRTVKLVKAPFVVRTTLSLHDGELLIDAS